MLAGSRALLGVRWRSGGVCRGLRHGGGVGEYGRWRRSGGDGFRVGCLGVITRRVERPQDLGDEEVEIRRIGWMGARRPACT
eukprot:2408643-Pleurochrysis_carterae.AAC.1